MHAYFSLSIFEQPYFIVVLSHFVNNNGVLSTDRWQHEWQLVWQLTLHATKGNDFGVKLALRSFHAVPENSPNPNHYGTQCTVWGAKKLIVLGFTFSGDRKIILRLIGSIEGFIRL